MPILYYSTNNPSERVSFREAILNGMASNYGLYMVREKDLPRFSREDLKEMRNKSYSELAYRILLSFVYPDIPSRIFKKICDEAYDEKIIKPELQKIAKNIYVLWLSKGPTYSFKDFAARFFGRVLNFFLAQMKIKKIVIVATSGDTGGAVANALWKLDNVANVVFFPADAISEEQRRQMTTLKENIYAFAVNGDFDVCQELAKKLLGDTEFAEKVFRRKDIFTSANSISLGRLLPQSVYPFYAYSRMELDGEPFIPSIPSGNFGDMMGTILAKKMGLPVKRLVCGVNENRVFPEFLSKGIYRPAKSVWSPSTAMIVSHPSNLARLIDLYGGHMYDERDEKTGDVIKAGIIDKMPDLEALRRDIYSCSITNEEHYSTIMEVYEKFGVILDPHGSVGWKAITIYYINHPEDKDVPGVVYETAEPGKFPEDIEKAIGIRPEIPEGIKREKNMDERIYRIDSPSDINRYGKMVLSDAQYEEAKEKIKDLLLLSL